MPWKSQDGKPLSHSGHRPIGSTEWARLPSMWKAMILNGHRAEWSFPWMWACISGRGRTGGGGGGKGEGVDSHPAGWRLSGHTLPWLPCLELQSTWPPLAEDQESSAQEGRKLSASTGHLGQYKERRQEKGSRKPTLLGRGGREWTVILAEGIQERWRRDVDLFSNSMVSLGQALCRML